MVRLSDRGVFLTLTATRWLPVGLVIGLVPLLALERGLTVSEVMTYSAAQGAAVLLLELPTSGFSDAFGRRPVLLAAAALNVAVGLLYLAAGSFWTFALAVTLTGVYRSLNSGPLEAWYVDRAHAREPGADVAKDLSQRAKLPKGPALSRPRNLGRPPARLAPGLLCQRCTPRPSAPAGSAEARLAHSPESP